MGIWYIKIGTHEIHVHQTAFGLLEGCIDKLNFYDDRNIFGKLSVTKTVETPVKLYK
jgi:hypothetical protein